ncbi:MAG: acyltransferase family protein [Candidatus Symbiothrix sp.]|jgi:fucose 4-O-acetylase-like acetyltransferase|nr:acyltransferase family protein [Candidatus Symbiothrix sp.]
MKRNLSVDILKLVMSFLIVGIHGGFLREYHLNYPFSSGIARIGVPVFLIISGFYFYEIKSQAKFVNWVKRLFYLYIIWTMIYSILWIPDLHSYKELMKIMFYGSFHLWYLVNALYAFIFIWIIRNLKFSKQLILVIFCTILGLLLQYGDSYNLMALSERFLRSDQYFLLYRNGLFFCFPFIMIGYFINQFSLYTRKVNWLLLLTLSFFLMAFEVVFNYFFTHREGGFELLVSLYAICPILFIYTLNKPMYSTNKTVALYATGVYLTHGFLVSVCENMGLLSNMPSVKTIAVFIVSMLITYILVGINKKFKYIL